MTEATEEAAGKARIRVQRLESLPADKDNRLRLLKTLPVKVCNAMTQWGGVGVEAKVATVASMTSDIMHESRQG